jgi:hypothetical protein
MPKKNSSPWAGLSIRIPEKDVKALRRTNSKLPGRSINRLLHRMVRESLLLADSKPFSVMEAKLLRKIRARPKLRALFRSIADEDVRRTVPNDDTLSVKFPFSMEERDRLKRLTAILRWSTAQLTLEAIQSFLVLAGAEEPLEQEQVPTLLETYRAILTYRGTYDKESESRMRNELNRFIKPPDAQRLDPNSPALEPMETFLDLI